MVSHDVEETLSNIIDAVAVMVFFVVSLRILSTLPCIVWFLTYPNSIDNGHIFSQVCNACINGTSSKTLLCVLGYGLIQAHVVTVFRVLFHTQ